MFWRRYDPYGYRFGSFLFKLLIAFVIIYFVVAAVIYIGTIALLIALGVGLAIGLVYSLITYVKAMIEAARITFGRSNQKFTIMQYLRFIMNTSKIAFMQNLEASKKSYYRSKQYRLISVKKWAWLTAAAATFAFGTALLLLCIAANAVLCIVLFALLLCLAMLALLLPAIAHSLFTICPNFVKTVADHNPWAVKLGQRSAKAYSGEYFSTLLDVIRVTWSDNLKLIRSNISASNSMGFLNFKKYILMISPCIIIPAELALFLCSFILFGLSYLPLLLVNSFKKKP